MISEGLSYTEPVQRLPWLFLPLVTLLVGCAERRMVEVPMKTEEGATEQNRPADSPLDHATKIPMH